MSKATVSKAVTRLEERLGARLFNRTSRRLALTDAGTSSPSARRACLSDGEAAENEALAQSVAPRGPGPARRAHDVRRSRRWRRYCRSSSRTYPEVSVDLHLSDATIDLIGEGFDMAVRIARLPDSSLIARRLFTMPRFTVAAPSYLRRRRDRPTHPMHLASTNASATPISRRPMSALTNSAGRPASVACRADGFASTSAKP